MQRPSKQPLAAPPTPRPGRAGALDVADVPGWGEIALLACLSTCFAAVALLGSMAAFIGIIGAALCGFALLTAMLFRLGHQADLRWIKRTRRGQCPACGYDLRGNANTPRCPECGKPVTPWV